MTDATPSSKNQTLLEEVSQWIRTVRDDVFEHGNICGRTQHAGEDLLHRIDVAVMEERKAVETTVPQSPNMPKRERPQKAPNKSGKQYVDELARYCGLQSGWLDIAPSFQLEYILEQWANAKDDVLRLHHAYMDIKLKELAVKAEPLQGPYCPDTNQPCDRMCQSICNRRECAHEFLPTAGQALSETDPRCIKCHRRWSSVNGRP